MMECSVEYTDNAEPTDRRSKDQDDVDEERQENGDGQSSSVKRRSEKQRRDEVGAKGMLKGCLVCFGYRLALVLE
jgi:hypothetical protein